MPYNVHIRSMNNYTDLGLSKQESLILKTNGAAAARDVYSQPATVVLLGRSGSYLSTTGNNNIGLLVYTIHYEFSG